MDLSRRDIKISVCLNSIIIQQPITEHFLYYKMAHPGHSLMLKRKEIKTEVKSILFPTTLQWEWNSTSTVMGTCVPL